MKNNFSASARIKSFGYAFKGLAFFFRTQHNAWIQLAAAALAIAGGGWFHISTFEWCAVILCIGVVFAAELFNTAMECLCNIVSPSVNETIGRVKDVAAGAVLIACITALGTGLVIFLPRLFPWH